VELEEIAILDRIYRIFRIHFQFPEKTEKTQSTFNGDYQQLSFFASCLPNCM
jgi:hypothetical protein